MHTEVTKTFLRDKANSRKRTNSFTKNVSSLLHCFAGLLLLLFALSHFAFLRITGYVGTLPNQVFPFFANNDLYLTAGIFEGISALICFKFCGRDFTNYFILSFVAMMLLYHWAFNFTGGIRCECLGLLGRLLNVNKRAEKNISYLALAFLALTTMPWLYSCVRVALRRGYGKLSLGLMIMMVLLTAHADGELNQAIEIYGTYNGTSQNPVTGEAQIADYQHIEALFHVVICGENWIISATNLNEISDATIHFNVPKSSVGQMWCDGTNTYCLQPDIDHDAGQFTNIVTVTPSRFYTESYDTDFLGMSLPWLTYCLSPATIHPDEKGVVALPVPWLQPRFSAFGHGYKWMIASTEDGRFITNLFVMRDTNLDLSDEDSLLRPDFVYPDSLPRYEQIKAQLNAFRYVPSGWIQTKFECTEWYRTNGISIPARSEITGFYFNPQIQNPHPSYRGELKISKIILDKINKKELFPDVILPTRVSDFRYRRTNATRIYRLAQYTLQPGESWKSDDDKALLDQAANYLKNGPKYNAFLHKKNTLVWLAFGIVSLIPMLIILKSRIKQNKT